MEMSYSRESTAPLDQRGLAGCGARVGIPTYDRVALTPSVVHIGVGRSNTVLSRGERGDQARVIGAIRRYLYAPEDDRLVTLTITANGYGGDARAIRYLVDALAVRRTAGRAPFTVLSCDNLTDNGAVTRTAVMPCAERRDPSVPAWLEEHAAFPSSMIDRITPCTTEEDRAYLERCFGVRDGWPVVTEPFSQWVIEDAFSAGRPPLDRVGVQFVSDVRPYALTKTRMLNASHSSQKRGAATCRTRCSRSPSRAGARRCAAATTGAGRSASMTRRRIASAAWRDLIRGGCSARRRCSASSATMSRSATSSRRRSPPWNAAGPARPLPRAGRARTSSPPDATGSERSSHATI